jgi:biopolymer transport protein ExbB
MIDPNHFLIAATASDGLKSTLAFLQKGGLFMIPLAVTSIVGIAAILYKFLSLTRNRVIPESLARHVSRFEDLLASNQEDSVLREFDHGASALARLSAVAIRHRGKPQRDIILAVEASAREETARLHAGIGVLDIVITVAPLLGLLGTASGLVTIFEGLSESADHLAIARGIAEALNTTIFGLAIAVPCVIAHGYFTRKIEMFTARLESLLADLAHVCQHSATND